MEKYNNILKNITELIEKGLLGSKDLKKEAEKALKFREENIEKKILLKKNQKGKETFTLNPFKGLFSNEIPPPCARIISFAIDNPKPTPYLF